jgi:hypothetical protein
MARKETDCPICISELSLHMTSANSKRTLSTNSREKAIARIANDFVGKVKKVRIERRTKVMEAGGPIELHPSLPRSMSEWIRRVQCRGGSDARLSHLSVFVPKIHHQLTLSFFYKSILYPTAPSAALVSFHSPLNPVI